jgi:hypothetical protein
MAIIGKVGTTWAGTSGGPGLTQLYIEDIGSAALTQSQAQAAVNAVRAFWDAGKTYLPDEIVLTVGTVVDMYDPADGQLVNTITAVTPPATVAGTSATSYAMAAGLKVNLQTANIRNGRRVRGSIYVVPATTAAMTTGGAAASAARTAFNTAGNALMAALATVNVNLIVWGRPLFDDQGALLRNGSVNYVTAVETNEKLAVLRGRRD